MEVKNTKNNSSSNNNDKKKKKFKTVKKYSLCFPFHINIKVIKDQKLILNFINNIQDLLSQKINSFFFGLNSSLNLIQNQKMEEKLLFIFYKNKMETLYDVILFRAKFNTNVYIYFIDEEFQKKFLEIFKLKKLLSFALIKNNLNESKFNEIKNNLDNYNLNNDKNKDFSKNNIQEIIIEAK